MELDIEEMSEMCYAELLAEMKRQFPKAKYFYNWKITFEVEE